MLHQNIDGLIGKQDMLSVHIEEIREKGTILDVICITEHNFISTDRNLVKLNNFKLASCSMRDNRHGGSCILVRNTHKFQELKDIVSMSIPNKIECSAIKLNEHNLIIICVYRPPKHTLDVLDTFYSVLGVILKKNCLNKKKVIVCGDFNINRLINDNENKLFEQLLGNYNMKLVFKEATRLKSGKCIDNFAHNVRGCKSEILELALSDHTAQLLKCPVPKSSLFSHWFIYRRDYSDDNIRKFVSCLSALSFSEAFNCTNAEQSFDSFYDTFTLFYYLCFPVIKVKIHSCNRARWITKGIKRCSKKKRDLLWKARKCNSDYNKNIFKNYSNRLKHIIKLTQKAQNDYFIKNSKNRSKATWKVINQNINKSSRNIEYIDEIKHNNKLIQNPKEMATNFNNYFIDQVETNSMKPVCRDSFKTKNDSLHSCFMKLTTPSEVESVIRGLKNTHTTGYDDISTKIIKIVATLISGVLSHTLNLCIQQGVFPKKLKVTIIKPLYKKKERNNMAHYRPIAKIPVFSKIFEKIIHKSLYSFLERYHLLKDNQVGFRKNKSINLAIYNFLQQVNTGIDQGFIVTAIYMDLKKAFDYVEHNRLLKKLNNLGIRGNVQKLIKSYLEDRVQATEIEQISSTSKTLIKYESSYRITPQGVPQGSVMGPLLFIGYTNDFPDCIEQYMVQFADDSTVLFISKTKSDIESTMNDSLSKLIDWLTTNNLHINLDKTHVMVFKNRKNMLENLEVSYNDESIKETKETKFLGLIIDNGLTWKSHVESVCSKLSQYSYALYMLGKLVNRSAVLSVYHAQAGSTLRYGIIFWGSSTDVGKAFIAQKKCIRSICHLEQTDSCRPHFKELKILTLFSLYIYEIIIFVKCNDNLFKNLTLARHKHMIKSTTHKTTQFNKSVLGMAPIIYNKLPKSFHDYKNLCAFKRHLKTFLTGKAYYSLNEYLNDTI